MKPVRLNTAVCKFIGQLMLVALGEIGLFIGSCRSPNEVLPNSNHSTLVLVQIIFRHGERTPMRFPEVYAYDPYINYTYEPYGLGELTNKGKQTELRLGKYLRKYYTDFLRDYHRDIVYAKSSPVSRCRMSLLLVLAGLFPPLKSLALEDDLNWQPIPYDYVARDYTFAYFRNCKRFNQLMEEHYQKAIENDEIKDMKDVIRKLEFYSGVKLIRHLDVCAVYTQLRLQKDFGLELPEWTQQFMPKPLQDFETLHFNLSTRNDELRRLSGGFIVADIIQAMISKKTNPEFENRKIHLYSGHEFTVSNLMGTLGLKVGSYVPFGSFLSLELHKIGDDYAVKILFHDSFANYPTVLKLEGCNEICPLDKFLKSYSKYMATPDMCE